MTAPEPGVVSAWHEALNAGEADRLAGFSHPKVEGPVDHRTGAYGSGGKVGKP